MIFCQWRKSCPPREYFLYQPKNWSEVLFKNEKTLQDLGIFIDPVSRWGNRLCNMVDQFKVFTYSKPMT